MQQDKRANKFFGLQKDNGGLVIMYEGFKLELDVGYDAQFFGEHCKQIGKRHLSEQKHIISQNLKHYIINGIDLIDGSVIEEEWFPQIEADIFISHSHKDIDLVHMLAGWINSKFGLKCFVDSNVWAFCDDLAELLNSEYSNKRRSLDNDGYLYDYTSCQDVSKHVNTMLTLSLYKMIDRTETLFFLNTPNSIAPYANDEQESSKSPWIYSELMCSEIVRRQLPSRKGFILEHSDGYSYASEGANIMYKVPTKHLLPLNIETLQDWENAFQQDDDKHPLDILYSIVNV